MKRCLIILLSAVIVFTACSKGKHFITDPAYRKTIHEDYLKRTKIAQNRKAQLFNYPKDLSLEEREALEFLYAYMPLSDLADYNLDYYLNQVRYSFMTRDTFSWGKTIPEDIFRHFVLVYRVNNEDLDTARMVIFNEIKNRVKNMSMHDAALEVNHWCHEHVAYRPSDSRTSSSLASMRTSWGRCGEESTFTVTAMRAVGIPARQCYTPRWAHSNDNHAWVEVWVDGNWYFLGACEPDAELNMGWFAAPAKRAMMVHSNAFGKYVGTEEINAKSDYHVRINMLSNYTDTKKIHVKVVDLDGKAVDSASVRFKLYNYAEYYPIAVQQTDANGVAGITTGLGDLLIWANKDGIYGYQKIDVRVQDSLLITLNRNGSRGEDYVEYFDMVPPIEKTVENTITEEQAAFNGKRLAYEDSIRNAYTATFPTEAQAKSIINENLTPEQIWYIIDKSEGNYAEMEKLMNLHAKKEVNIYLNDFFKSMAEKDLRDAKADILEQHITHWDSVAYPFEIYLKGIISPRINYEILRPWRPFLAKEMATALGEQPTATAIVRWIQQNITLDRAANWAGCPISPQGVYELRVADPRSADIFFVAACRSLNIPAYKDWASGQIYAWEKGEWIKYSIGKEENREKKTEMARLVLEYNPQGKEKIKPEYWIHYTIAKEQDGDFVTYDYEDDARITDFPIMLDLEPGYYLLSTGNRYPEGEVLSQVEYFHLTANKPVHKTVELRPLVERVNVYGKIDVNAFFGDKNELTLSSMLKNKDVVICFIDPSREPTRHLLKDMGEVTDQLDKWGGEIYFVIPSSKNTGDFNSKVWKLPKHSSFMIDPDSKWMNSILANCTENFSGEYPLIFIVNETGKIYFRSEGYRIGTGELIYKTLKR